MPVSAAVCVSARMHVHASLDIDPQIAILYFPYFQYPSCCFLFELVNVNSNYKITGNVFGAKLLLQQTG